MTSQPKLKFQLVQSKQLDLVIAMMRALEEDDPNKKPFDERSRRDACEKLMREPHLGRMWIILMEGRAVGYVVLTYMFSFEYAGRGAFIDELYVVREHRRKGIGTQALVVVERFARESGLRTLHLEVSRGNSGAVSLYRRAHFADHDRYLLTKWLD